MIIEQICSNENIESACDYLLKKRDSCGLDGMYLSELPTYLAHNKNLLVRTLSNGDYKFKLAEKRVILGKSGKQRQITLLNSIDRLVLRMMYQVMNPVLSVDFCENSFAYIEGRGTFEAVETARKCIENGLEYVTEIDIRNYFDSINHTILMEKLSKYDFDTATLCLIRGFLNIKVKFEDRIQTNTLGILQGSSLSPLLSNLFLSDIDHSMDLEKIPYIRFSDDIKIFTSDFDSGSLWLKKVSGMLDALKLKTSDNKCGVFPATNRTYFGYEMIQTKDGILTQRRSRSQSVRFTDWNTAKLEWRDGDYHIVSDGILTKKDFSILFENPDKKMYIPVEVTDSISIHSDVVLSANFMKFASNHRLIIRFYDSYGEYVGAFMPMQQRRSVKATLFQSTLYLDNARRLALAKKIIIAGTRSIKSNLQYYKRRRSSPDFDTKIGEISAFTKQMNEQKALKNSC